MNWHLQDAKNNFSKVVQKARTEGPQTVTLRGKPAAVVISAEEYERLAGTKKTIVDYLLDGPGWDDEFAAEVERRPKWPSRPDIDF